MANPYENAFAGSDYTPPVSMLSGIASQKKMLIIFMVDNSGSMSMEECMDAVNEAFERMVPALQDLQRKVNDAFELEIAIMTFGSMAKWIVEPTPILQYFHTKIQANGGGTSYGNALRALKEKLTEKEFMAHKGKIAEPYIMFMTDGYPQDSDYENVIQELKENLWYVNSQRYAVLIGKSAISNSKARAAVEAFVSDPVEGIIDALDAEAIVQNVSAKTIHTVKGMTQHRKVQMSEEPGETHKNRKQEPDFLQDWNFDDDDLDLDKVYGGNFVF